MNLTQFAIEKKALSYFVALLILLGGIGSFFTLGHMEDPNFTNKKGVVVTQYPGASPEEVELEVTDRLEKVL